jgi:hypothetical protein
VGVGAAGAGTGASGVGAGHGWLMSGVGHAGVVDCGSRVHACIASAW